MFLIPEKKIQMINVSLSPEQFCKLNLSTTSGWFGEIKINDFMYFLQFFL